jgi:hypothetical protein
MNPFLTPLRLRIESLKRMQPGMVLIAIMHVVMWISREKRHGGSLTFCFPQQT